MKQRLALALTLLLGVLVGTAVPRWLTVPAFGQTPMSHMTPSSMPMASAAPPMGGLAKQCLRMMQMMPAAMSSADRAYMSAMMQMHSSMMREPTTGNPDRDFLTMMIPHHQSAVAMAQAELRYGTDPKVKALARNIIAAQQMEIKQMRAWLK